MPALTLASTLAVRVTEKNGAGVADAAVYAMPIGAKIPPVIPGKAIIDQVNKEFVPLVSVFQAGTAVVFPNRDNIRHHVYSFSPSKVFELKLYSGQPAAPIVFDKPGIVTLGCNIHDWMISYVVVVDSPYFGKTDASGNLRLENLPPGEYEVKIWHYRASQPSEITATRKLSVDGPGGNARFEINLTGKPVGTPGAR